MERLNLTIDGMSCGHCVAAVSRALTNMEGVSIERVDVGAATVTYDPARTSPDDIIDAVNDEGYQASRAQ